MRAVANITPIVSNFLDMDTPLAAEENPGDSRQGRRRVYRRLQRLSESFGGNLS